MIENADTASTGVDTCTEIGLDCFFTLGASAAVDALRPDWSEVERDSFVGRLFHAHTTNPAFLASARADVRDHLDAAPATNGDGQ